MSDHFRDYSPTRRRLSAMKILHALVGYLAATALPFHPFSFASPLATIDYDSYDTTQNQSDKALMKRVPGDIIEARQLELIPTVFVIAAIIAGITAGILWIVDDDPKREAFTQNTINKMISQYPKFNWVICHSPYLTGFEGVEGTDWGYTHHELRISLGRTIGYDLFWAGSGIFYRYGDGGFVNWAYNGNILGTYDDGSTVNFGTPS